MIYIPAMKYDDEVHCVAEKKRNKISVLVPRTAAFRRFAVFHEFSPARFRVLAAKGT